MIGLIIVGAACLLLFQPFDPVDRSRLSAGAGPAGSAADGPEGAAGQIRDPDEQPGSPLSKDEVGLVRETMGPSGPLLAGCVIDQVTGEPVTLFDFVLTRDGGEEQEDKIVRDLTVRDPDGRFSFVLNEAGTYSLLVTTSRHLEQKLDALRVEKEKGLTDLCVKLDPGYSISGRVVEDATGEPVTRALVGVRNRTDVGRIVAGRPESTLHTYTDEKGEFELSGLGTAYYNRIVFSSRRRTSRFTWRVAALHDDYAQSYVDVKRDAREGIEIRLKPGYRVFGKACGDDGRPEGGVRVSTQGDNIALRLCTLTGQDGSYRTQPVLPGTVSVQAQPPGSETEESSGFTGESWQVDLKDQDVELNFGPLPDHVILRGTVTDYDGQPAADAGILVRARDRVKEDGRLALFYKRVKTDENGCFEMKKLLTGKYSIYLEFARQSRFFWKTVTFETGGVHEKEIRVTGGTILGVVLDSITGQPLEDGNCRIRARKGRSSRYYSVNKLEEGRFCLRGLESGSYSISLTIRDNPKTERDDVVVKEGEVVDDFVIVAHRGGTVRYRITGFDASDLRRFRVRLEYLGSADRSRSKSLGGGRINGYGELEREEMLLAGTWEADFTGKNLGSVKRRFVIVPDAVTELVVCRADFPLYDGFVTVAGQVTFSDGSPAANASLQFSATTNVVGVSGSDLHVRGKTDAEGRFSLHRFKPGEWSIYVVLEDGGRPAVRSLVLPEDPLNPFPFSIVLPRGEVIGAVFNKVTGYRPGNNDPACYVYLRDAVTSGRTARSTTRGQGGRFRFTGIRAGTYYLSVSSGAFESFRSDPFVLDEAQKLDLGDIPLYPRGLLVLEVVDAAGQPVDDSWAYFETSGRRRSGRNELSPGRYLYYGLPLGITSFKIRGSGFKQKDVEICLLPGVQHEMRVVLERS